MQISNFNVYKVGKNANDANGFTNYQGLNMLSTVFSVMFTIFNSILMSFIFERAYVKSLVVGILYSLQIFVLMWTNFKFNDMTFHSWVAVIIAAIYTMILIPAFGTLSDSILQETIDEQKLGIQKQDFYRKMFDSIPEGVVMIQADKVMFMNDLSNRLLSTMCDLKNFFFNRKLDGGLADDNPLDKKIFYVFENSKNPGMVSTGKKADKKKKNTSSETTSKASDKILVEKNEYSLNEIANMDTPVLNSKIFTFEKKLASDDLTKMVNENKERGNLLANTIRGLKCMRGIEDVPTFKFF